MPRNPNKRKCAGHKTDGSPCGKWAMRGATVCDTCGGRAPQVKAAAARNVALAEAGRMMALAGVDMDPLDHLLDALYRARQLVLVYGTMAAALDDEAEQEAHAADETRGGLGYMEAGEDSHDELVVFSRDRLLALNKFGEAQLHPYQQAYERAIERHGKLAKLCLDAKIDERRMQMTEAQVDLAQRAFEAMLEDMALTGTQRQEARQSYARHLRLVPAAS